MIKSGKCPECGCAVGSEPGTDPYKHAINCLHLDKGRPSDMIEQAGKQSKERGARAAALLAMSDAA